MNGFDVQQWIASQEKAQEMGLKLEVVGDSLRLLDGTGFCIGVFREVKDVYFFLLGYDWGFTRGKNQKSEEENDVP